jgi:hypothetical protein
MEPGGHLFTYYERRRGCVGLDRNGCGGDRVGLVTRERRQARAQRGRQRAREGIVRQTRDRHDLARENVICGAARLTVALDRVGLLRRAGYSAGTRKRGGGLDHVRVALGPRRERRPRVFPRRLGLVLRRAHAIIAGRRTKAVAAPRA